MFFDESWIISYHGLHHRGRTHESFQNTIGRKNSRTMSMQPTRRISQEIATNNALFDFSTLPTAFTDIGV